MPRTRLTTHTPTLDDRFRAEIARNIEMLGLSKAEAIKRCGMTTSRWYARMNDPGSTTRDELKKFKDGLGLNDRQICAMVGVAYHGATEKE